MTTAHVYIAPKIPSEGWKTSALRTYRHKETWQYLNLRNTPHLPVLSVETRASSMQACYVCWKRRFVAMCTVCFYILAARAE